MIDVRAIVDIHDNVSTSPLFDDLDSKLCHPGVSLEECKIIVDLSLGVIVGSPFPSKLPTVHMNLTVGLWVKSAGTAGNPSVKTNAVCTARVSFENTRSYFKFFIHNIPKDLGLP